MKSDKKTDRETITYLEYFTFYKDGKKIIIKAKNITEATKQYNLIINKK